MHGNTGSRGVVVLSVLIILVFGALVGYSAWYAVHVAVESQKARLELIDNVLTR